MNKNYRKFCPTHHYFYNGNECPFCFQERINKIKIPETKPMINKNDKGITEEMLQNLVNKYKK